MLKFSNCLFYTGLHIAAIWYEFNADDRVVLWSFHFEGIFREFKRILGIIS